MREKVYIYTTTTPHEQNATQSSIFKQSLTDLNSEFFFS